MRHLGTLIAAVVIAPLAWLLIAFGQDHSVTAFTNAQSNGAFHTGDFVSPLVALAVAGIAFGLIGTLRFSPLGATVAGVAYVASYVGLLIAPARVDNLFAYRIKIFGQSANVETPIRTGTTLLVGALLLVAVASAKRWRRWPAPEGEETASSTGGTDDKTPPSGLSSLSGIEWPSSEPSASERDTDTLGFGGGFGGSAQSDTTASAEPVTTQRIVSRPTSTLGSPWRTPPGSSGS